MKFFITLLIISTITFSQSEIPPKRELRAVWVASVSNIDWPSTSNLSPTQQRSEYTLLLNRHKLNGMNALVVQVRPSCDAFYDSPYEPWSQWLTGQQGRAPNPYYDPLTFLVEETHKRGMEFHAWFNPYRAVVSASASVHSSHISVTKPEWIVPYGSAKYLNPGLPDVREYVTKIIMDVVRRYDIDGVHFDDYFYPYPIDGQTFNDDAAFTQFPNGFTNKDDWRRNNINLLIQMVNDSIKSVKPWVKFGISPFGIWRNQNSDPNGSATNGLQSYSAIYADSRKWMQEGWLDYINPQIYWNIGYAPARFEVLVPWWSNNSFGRHFYVGHAAYKIGTSTQDPAWMNPTQMPDQIRFARQYPQVKGSVYFSSKSITNNLLGIQDSLRNNFYKFPSFVPEMPWLDSIPPLPPSNLTAVKVGNFIQLDWERPAAASDGDLAKYFVVYLFDDTSNININDPRAIRHITANDTNRYFDNLIIDTTKIYTYIVTSMDRLHNESASIARVTFPLITSFEEQMFVANEYKLLQNYPNPFNPSTIINFQLPSAGNVELKVFDVLGREVAILVNNYYESGNHSVELNANEYQLNSGVYFYQIRAGDFVETRKMQLIK